jgi:hydroxypyruvate isomerase
LLQVWVENGGGFNAYPAGRSVATARRVSAGDWAAHETWVRQISRVNENMRLQIERAREWRQALRWETKAVMDGETTESGVEHDGDEDMYECV